MLVSVAVTVVVRFLVLTRVIPLIPILSAIPRDWRESTQVFEVLKEVLYGFDCILSNFLQVFSLFSILAKLLPSVLPVCFTELKSFSIYSVKSSSSLSSPSSLIRPLFALAMWRVRTSLSMWPSKSDPT